MAFASPRYYVEGGHFVANRAFEYSGKQFAAGDVFDWRALGVGHGKVDELWTAFYIEGISPEALAEQAKPKAVNVQRKR